MDKINRKENRHHLTGWFSVVFVLLVLNTITARAMDIEFRDPRQYFFIQSFGDMPEELLTVRAQQKQGILLFFEADGCQYCAAMLKGVLGQKKVQDWYRERFSSIAIDIRGDVEIKDFDQITLPEKVFAEHRRVFLTPTLSFIDLDGVEIYRHTGMVKTAEEFLVMGEYIAGKHYFDTEFKVYAEMRGLQNAEGALVTPAQKSTN
jgi:thioredoxin-related protein